MPRNCLSETGFSFSSCSVKSGALSLIFMSQYLYLKIVRRATSLLLLTCALPVLGQYSSARRSEPRNTTRAVAVVEIDAKGLARLYPVMLMLEGRVRRLAVR